MGFFDQLLKNPHGWGSLPPHPKEIAYEDDAGNSYAFDGGIVKKGTYNTPMTLGETALATATAPAKIATGLASTLSPYGSEGWQVPPVISEPIAAGNRLLSSGGFPDPQDPQNQQDAVTSLLAFFGANAFNPIPKGALASNAVRSAAESSRPSLIEQQSKTPGITAYHGSPHDFDKFDISKIGTGEGAQAYGFGLYFAENEGVAKSYRDILGNYDDAVKWKGDQPPTEVQQRLLNQLKGSDVRSGRAMDISKLKRELAMSIRDAEHGMFPNEKRAAEYRAQFDELQRMEPNIEFSSPGHMYQVKINANPEDFLDWDKPLSQQSEKARAAFQNSAAWEDLINQQTAQVERLKAGGSIFEPTPERIAEFSAPLENRQVADLMHDLHFKNGPNQLREAGIPGIRYLDGSSRGVGEGSSNYVVFDDNLIEILKKYGLIPGLYGASQMGDKRE